MQRIQNASAPKESGFSLYRQLMRFSRFGLTVSRRPLTHVRPFCKSRLDIAQEKTSNHSQSEKCSPTKGRVWRKLRKSSSPVLKRPETAQTRTTMSAGSGKRYDKPAPDVPFSPADRGSVSPAVPPALCRRDEIPDLRERFRQKFHVRMPSAQPDDDFPRVPNDSARYRE